MKEIKTVTTKIDKNTTETLTFESTAPDVGTTIKRSIHCPKCGQSILMQTEVREDDLDGYGD